MEHGGMGGCSIGFIPDLSGEGFLQMVALAFLKAIGEIPSLGISRFNSDAFYKDAAQALKEEGYLQHSAA